MTDDRMPDNIDPKFMQDYRNDVRRGLERNLRNMYIYNVRASHLNEMVKNACQMTLQPDERYMRYIEHRVGIDEAGVLEWRQTVWNQWRAGSTELLDQRLGTVFRDLAEAYGLVQKALMIYPNDIRIEVESENADSAHSG